MAIARIGSGGSGDGSSASDHSESARQYGEPRADTGTSTDTQACMLLSYETNEAQLRAKAVLTYMRLITRPTCVKRRACAKLRKWAKVINEQKRVDALKAERGEAPSASTRRGSTAPEQQVKAKSGKSQQRVNKGSTLVRSRIGWRVVERIERMGAAAKRISRREKKGDG